MLTLPSDIQGLAFWTSLVSISTTCFTMLGKWETCWTSSLVDVIVSVSAAHQTALKVIPMIPLELEPVYIYCYRSWGPLRQQAERPVPVSVRTPALYCLCRHWCIRSSHVLAPTRQGCSGEMWRLTSTQLLNFHTLLTAILPGANARLVCPPQVPAVFTCARACCSHFLEVRWSISISCAGGVLHWFILPIYKVSTRATLPLLRVISCQIFTLHVQDWTRVEDKVKSVCLFFKKNSFLGGTMFLKSAHVLQYSR